MIDPAIRARAIALYDQFTHDHGDRRRFMQAMVALAGSVAAAEVLVAGIAASPAAAQQVPLDDPRLRTALVTGRAADKPLRSYSAIAREGRGRRGTVLVIHENRGLTPHIMDVTRRLALDGFNAVALDLLTPIGGTPEDEDRARRMIGQLDYDLALAQTKAVLKRIKSDRQGTRRVGAVGFCWGGAFVNRLAVSAGEMLDAGVSYYGPAPAPTEAARVDAPLLIHLAGTDQRVNATALPWGEALKAAGKTVTVETYPGVDHAFNNDTSAERYDKAAADLAWRRTTDFLRRYLS